MPPIRRAVLSKFRRPANELDTALLSIARHRNACAHHCDPSVSMPRTESSDAVGSVMKKLAAGTIQHGSPNFVDAAVRKPFGKKRDRALRRPEPAVWAASFAQFQRAGSTNLVKPPSCPPTRQ